MATVKYNTKKLSATTANKTPQILQFHQATINTKNKNLSDYMATVLPTPKTNIL